MRQFPIGAHFVPHWITYREVDRDTVSLILILSQLYPRTIFANFHAYLSAQCVSNLSNMHSFVALVGKINSKKGARRTTGASSDSISNGD